ncbi:MAG: type II methionyl aminopeptidase [archaeon]
MQENSTGKRQQGEPTNFTKYRDAGRIAKKVVDHLKKTITADSRLLDIANDGEKMIRDLGAGIAFPINLGINEVAAHYTPVTNDRLTVGENLLKVDIGAHIDGYIADTAFSLDFSGKHAGLIKASEKALAEATKMCVPGTCVKDIGAKIQETIQSFGFKPVSNLSGHTLDQYKVHGGVNIPNVPSGSFVLEEGMVIAIEPFATDGVGMIKDAPESMIFSYLADKPVRMREAKTILKLAKERYHKLPFASRWLKLPPLTQYLALNQLTQAKALYSYPILIEKERGVVSQSEHTVIVKDKPEVTIC